MPNLLLYFFVQEEVSQQDLALNPYTHDFFVKVTCN